jgi:hypothetical protein
MESLSTSNTALPFQGEYIQEFRYASAKLDSWKKKYENDYLAETTVRIWKETGEKLMESPHFAEGWHLPAFYQPSTPINAW